MVGGTLMGFLAGLHYWFPKMSGRMYRTKPSVVRFWLIILGFNVTFFPQFILGAAGHAPPLLRLTCRSSRCSIRFPR